MNEPPGHQRQVSLSSTSPSSSTPPVCRDCPGPPQPSSTETAARQRQSDQEIKKLRRDTALAILLSPIFVPIILVYVGVCYIEHKCTGKPTGFSPCGNARQASMRAWRQQKHAKKEAKLLPREAPRPLPVVRKRALTPSPSTRTLVRGRKQGCRDQMQSTLFARCPLEVRELIYGYYMVYDDRPVHVFRKTDRRLGSIMCSCSTNFRTSKPDWGYTKPSETGAWPKHKKAVPSRSHRLLPLLKTCKRVYSEMIDSLHSKNTFCFQDPLTLRYFQETVLPHRLAQISKVQIPWEMTCRGMLWSPPRLNEGLSMLHRLPSLNQITVIDGDSMNGVASWRTPGQEEFDVLPQAMASFPEAEVIEEQEVSYEPYGKDCPIERIAKIATLSVGAVK